MNAASVRKDVGALALRTGFAAALALLPAVALAADGFEPDDTPAQAPLVAGDGAPAARSFDPAGDVDWVRFRATAGERYLLATAGDSDTFLELYGTDGAELLEQDDDSGPAANARIVWECWYTGTYYVRSTHFSPASTGDYWLAIAQSGAIAGTVSFSGGGARPEYVEVTIYDAVTGKPVGGSSTGPHETWTYAVDGLLPGDYLARFDAVEGDFLGEWWQNGEDAYTAATIVVGAGETTWDISPVLDPGGSISGTVRFAGAGARPASVAIGLHPQSPSAPYRAVYADSAGGWTYRFSGLPKGSYRLEFLVEDDGRCSSYGSEWWDDRRDETSATPIVVVPGFDAEAIDPTLDVRYGAISGTVGFAPGGDYPDEVGVRVYDAATGDCLGDGYTSDAEGWHYLVCGLPEGDFLVGFDPYGGSYGVEWWEDSPDSDRADAVSVVAGLTTGGVSPTLDALARISGTVLFVPGGVQPLEVRVTVHAAADGDYVDSTFADRTSGWRYAIERLLPGAYRLEYTAYAYDGDYLSEWWDNASDFAAAADLVLTGGQDLRDVSPTLSTAVDDPVLFFDSFTHGSAAQDPDWTRVSGQWYIDARKRYASLSLDAVNLALVKRFVPPPLHLGAGRVETRVALTGRAAGEPNARIVFSCLGAGKYRYVELNQDRIAIGQVGTVGGTPRGVKAFRALAPAAPGALLPLRVDLRPSGLVVAYVKGIPVLKHRFPAMVRGAVGVGAVRAESVFDGFQVSDAGALP